MPRSNLPVVLILGLLVAAPPVDAAKGDPGPPDHAKARGHAKHADAAPESPPLANVPPPAAEPAPAPVATQTPAREAPAPAPASSAPASAPPVRAPTPVPERRLEAFDRGTLAAQSRAPLARAPSPLASPSADDAGNAPWAWALPILGMVGIGAALVATRPAQVTRAPPQDGLRYTFAKADAAELLRAGKAAVDASRFDEAVAWFTQALRIDPTLDVAHFCNGVCLAHLGRHDDAYRALREAHLLDPAEGAYRLELARAAARTGRSHEAMDVLSPLLCALPQLADDAAKDDAFATLGDHPRWLAMTGRL